MEKINKLKTFFKKYELDGYLIPKNDEYFSEYVSTSEDDLQYISNFSGSYGYALILKKNNYLFVDGRYTVQANKQSGKNFKIITLPFNKKKIHSKTKNKKVGYDPRLFNEQFVRYISKILSIKCFPLKKNLIKILKRDKKIQKEKKYFYILNKFVTGNNLFSKIKKLKKSIKKKNIDVMFISSSENVAWLLNIRGSDSNYSPIPNCYLVIDKLSSILFCDLKKINNKFKKRLKHINILDIDKLETFLAKISNKKFSIDRLTCSIFYKKIIENNNSVINEVDPIYSLKSIKNNVEISNTKRAHELDGAALTKFLFWVQNNFKKRKITEIIAQRKLYDFKKKFKEFKTLSFPTISSTGPNGAIVHYNATNKTNRILKSGNIYLVDSGGQYHYGTTDVTRTVSLDTKSKKIKKVFTKVLQGHLNLFNYQINKNTTGSDLDKIARKNLKQENLDYSHGTGHGVGYFLNVHEGPQSISKKNKVKLRSGMILSNEPGYYEKGKYGLRIENLIYIKKNKKKLKFENLTYVPIDKSLIIKKMLKKKEIDWLNDYHKKVFYKLKKYMNKSELILLKKSCSNI